MPPRGFTNPAPKTDSARTALTSFHCTLCNKSYSRHPEYEAHIGSYDHQHKKRLRDLKQLSRDPNAAERARRAERKADEKAGLVVVSASTEGGGAEPAAATAAGGGASGGFKKGGFKSSFAVVTPGTAPVGVAPNTASMKRKNVLADDEDEEMEDPDVAAGEVQSRERLQQRQQQTEKMARPVADEDAESDTDEEYGSDDRSAGGGYYDPRRPTGCFAGCPGGAVTVG